MKNNYKEIAIIGTTASGKTALALDIASETNSIILSLDSLAVYKYIDIASAKPTIEEMGDIVHFGIDEIYPNEMFDVSNFLQCYKNAKEYAIKHNKNLIIAGGTGFYLKALVDGISYLPPISKDIKKLVEKKLINLQDSYDFIFNLDKAYMKNIKSNDRYRIQKALELYYETKQIPTNYFSQNPKIPLVQNLEIFEIVWSKEILKDRIFKRTKDIIKNGIIDEVIFLEKNYTRLPVCMSTIGISQTLDYLDFKLTLEQLEEQIFLNTVRLAKQQRTFNNGQFNNIKKFEASQIKKQILSSFR